MTKTWTLALIAAAAAWLVAEATGPDAQAAPSGGYAIGVTTSQQGETPVVAVVDAATGRVRACWLRGPSSKPACSAWSE